jgi:nucleolar protein 53
MSAKRTKRIRQTNEEYESAVQQESQQKVLTGVDSENLFTVDRAGSKSKRRKVQEEILPKEQGKFVSKTEQHLIQKQLKRLQSGQPRKVYGSNVVDLPSSDKKIVSKLEDIWSEGDESDASSSKKARPHKHSLKVALPGQSYNPSFEDHQDTLAQAVSIHMKKIEDAKTAFDLIAEQEAEAQKNQQSLTLAGDSSDDEDDEDEDGSDGATKKKKTGPKYNVSGEKMQAMTAVIMDEDQSSGSDDSDDESNASDDEDAKNKKRRQKVLTKAQRNKRRARRQAEHEAKLVAMEKKKLCDIIVVKHIKKNLAKEEAERLAQKKVREALEVERKRAEEEEKTKRLRSYEVSAVPLTDELQGSLRAIKPKGAPTLDTMQSMIASGETRAAFARKRRAYEKPHGAKRQKWIPKYKV